MDRLPRDVLYRILDHVPIKSVVSFRCANKEYYGDPVIESRINKLVEDPKLVSLYNFPLWDCPYATPRFEVDAEANILKVSTPDAPPAPKCSCLLGSCNGLMCFYSDNRGHLLLVNPFLKEALPVTTSDEGLDPEDQHRIWKGFCGAGFGLDHVSGSYKFVAIMLRAAMVYNFSTRRWRAISPPPPTPKWLRGTFSGGILYWLAEDEYKGQMVSFDLAKEEFSTFPCHPSADSLFDLENQLGLGYSDEEGHIHILELNIHSKEWTKRYEIDTRILVAVGYDWEDYLCDYDILGIWNQRIVLQDGCFYCLYDPQSRKAEFRIWDVRDRPDYCIRGSLVSLSRFNS